MSMPHVSLDSLNAALYIACSYALPRVVHFLISKGASPNLLSSFGLAAFHMAVRSRPPWNHFERIKITLLHTGRSREVWHGLLYRTASVILKFGGDPNLRSRVSRLHDNCGHDCWRSPDCGQPGQTTLHLACAGGVDRLVALLLEFGANIELRDEGGYLPVYYAMAQGHCDITIRLLRKYTNPTEIIVVQRSQSTALHVAARFGSTTAAATLLDMGADANILDAFGITPREEATRQKNSRLRDDVEDVLDLLLRHGARVEHTQSPCGGKHNRRRHNLSVGDSIYERIFVPTLISANTSSINHDQFTQFDAQQRLMTSFPPINDEPQMANSRISEPIDSPWFDKHKRTKLFVDANESEVTDRRYLERQHYEMPSRKSDLATSKATKFHNVTSATTLPDPDSRSISAKFWSVLREKSHEHGEPKGHAKPDPDLQRPTKGRARTRRMLLL
jgi:ankyrin repeat protein